MKKCFKIFVYTIALTILVAIFIVSPISDKNVESQADSIFNDLEPFFEAISIVRSEYIQKDIDMEKLVQGAISGMLS